MRINLSKDLGIIELFLAFLFLPIILIITLLLILLEMAICKIDTWLRG